jgi:hypothetical protein
LKGGTKTEGGCCAGALVNMFRTLSKLIQRFVVRQMKTFKMIALEKANVGQANRICTICTICTICYVQNMQNMQNTLIIIIIILIII